MKKKIMATVHDGTKIKIFYCNAICFYNKEQHSFSSDAVEHYFTLT